MGVSDADFSAASNCGTICWARLSVRLFCSAAIVAADTDPLATEDSSEA